MSRHRRQQRRRARRSEFWISGKELCVRVHAGERFMFIRNAPGEDFMLVRCRRGPIGKQRHVPWCESTQGKRDLRHYRDAFRSSEPVQNLTLRESPFLDTRPNNFTQADAIFAVFRMQRAE